MGQCLSGSDIDTYTSTGAVSENIVDLQKIVSDSAWQMYSDCRQKDFPKFMKNVRLVFDWSGVKFIPEEPEYSEEVKDQVKSNILFESVFCNNSNKEQQHSLKTEQQTTATCKSSLTKGYTTGFNVGLSLASPAAIVGTTAGFSKGFSVENAFETEDQKTMTWAAEGVLLVEKESEVTAKLQITEQKSTYSFTTRVAVKGAVLVEFYKRKNNEYLMHYKADMRTILVEKQDKIKTEKGEILVEDREGTAYLKLGGKCVFKYGIKQEIIINQNGKNKQIKS